MPSQIDKAFWQGKRVFITGHTGFKGGWLSLWLQQLGAQVKGFSLAPPTDPSFFSEVKIADGMVTEIGDIRDLYKLKQSISDFKPDILIHMAAQPLVRHSYDNPVETYATNVMGTVNLFEAARQCSDLKAIVNVTSDKCYENKEWVWGYRENEPMGGHDPYSNSKGCAELVTSAYRNSFFSASDAPGLASARAGNVIGGGDWADDRLIPDILRAFSNKEAVVIRNPLATRPWQHVLEPLSGYLTLAQRLYEDGLAFAEGWNFGPEQDDVKSVKWILDFMTDKWGDDAAWEIDPAHQLHEAQLLKLDISKALNKLDWAPKWSLSKALESTIYWHKSWQNGEDMKAVSLSQIQDYQNENL